jgi:hypothetical protein
MQVCAKSFVRGPSFRLQFIALLHPLAASNFRGTSNHWRQKYYTLRMNKRQDRVTWTMALSVDAPDRGLCMFEFYTDSSA